ncbi:MAG TPA: M23 family metallopeptidase, partial [Terriglobales bacterium]|nr:M23 family metallopeptidase [Terriglobales bacterium]
LIVLVLLTHPVITQALEPAKITREKAAELFQGGLIQVRVSGPDLTAVEGRMGSERVYFYADTPGTFRALVGADVEAKPGVAKLFLRLIGRDGLQHKRELALKIKAKAFRKESFNVPPGFDEMTPEALEEIRREQAAFTRAFAAPTPQRLWEAPFVRPVPQEASASSFGWRRVINGVPRAPHSGTDLSAPVGTEVLAANNGRVVLVGNFFFAGGSVVLDHGGGLFTMYFHLSEFNVEEGDFVKKGNVVALSGATGRVTGPHLHWGARLANARINPLELLSKVSPDWAPPGYSKAVTDETEKQYGEKR